jgi:ketosteroid isomerase-like protein
MSMFEEIETFLTAWTAAEQAGDTDALDGLLASGFSGVGPLGFILSRQAWLARHRDGALTYTAFGLDETHIREFGDVAIVTGRQTATGTYRGHPVPEAVRATLVLATEAGTRRLATIHLSFIAGTPGAPPAPGQPHTTEGRTS